MSQRDMTTNAQNELRILHAEQEHVRTGRPCGPVIRSVYIIECCTGGEGTITINGKVFPFRAGACYALLPGDAVIHTTNPETHRYGYWCALDGLFLGSLLQQAGITSETPFFRPELFETIRDHLAQLVDLWHCRDAGATFRQIGCVHQLLGSVLEHIPSTESVSLMDRAIGYMQTNFPEAISVDAIARQVGLDRCYFSALFKQKTGLSPHQYLILLRLQKAAQLLEQPELSISDAADLVGLEPHNFARQFKREMGHTPQEYRRNLRRGHVLLKGRTRPALEQDE